MHCVATNAKEQAAEPSGRRLRVFAELNEVYQVETDFKAKVENEFNQLNERVNTP